MIRSIFIFSALQVLSVLGLSQMNLRLDYPANRIEVGESFTIELTITSVQEGTRFLNSEDKLPENLALIGVQDTFIGSSLFKRKFKLIPIDEDTFNFQLNLKFRKDFEVDSLLSEEIIIESTLIPVDKQSDVSNLKPFIEPKLSFAEKVLAKYQYLPYIITGVLLLLIAGLVIWFFTYFKNRNQKFTLQEELIEIEDPIERINTVIQHLESSSMEENEWYTTWSDNIRWYLGKVYGFNGMELTSSEVMAELQNEAEIVQIQSELSQALKNADMVKYAGISLSTDSMQQALAILKQSFEYTKHFFKQDEEQEVES